MSESTLFSARATGGYRVRNPGRRQFARLAFALTGWRVSIEHPVPAKCIVIGAPHTSGADLFATWFLMLVTGMNFSWAAKDELFFPPLGWFLRAIGGIPVNRRARTDFVGQMVKHFETRDAFVLGIAPEGTRGTKTFWKTGFYFIALRANVPMVFGYADYQRKVVGFGPMMMPSGDLDADFEHIKRYYSAISGRFPERQGEIRLKPPEKTAESDLPSQASTTNL